MKKLTALLVALAMLLTLTALGSLSSFAEENVALNKPVTVELHNGVEAPASYWRPEFLVDGLAQDTTDGNALGWAFGTANGVTDFSANAYINLGGVYTITSIKVVAMKWLPDTTVPGPYTLYLSNGGETWTKVAANGAGEHGAGQTKTYTVDPVDATHVRLEITAHSGHWPDPSGASLSGLGDIEVYGTKKSGSDAPTPVEISSASAGDVKNVWLRSNQPTDSDTMKILFRTNKDFTQFSIPAFWASNPPTYGSLKANIEVSLYKFDKDLETTLKGTPVASAKYLESLGDNNLAEPINVKGTGATLTSYNKNNHGFALVLDEPAKAGQYLAVIRNDAGEGSYLVLPSLAAASAAYDTKFIKYFFNSDEESFEEAVQFSISLVDNGSFVELDNGSGGQGGEGGNPSTGSKAFAFAAIITLALAAAVVFKKRIFG